MRRTTREEALRQQAHRQGQCRVRKVFLWLPKGPGEDRRWLEWAWVVEEFIYREGGYGGAGDCIPSWAGWVFRDFDDDGEVQKRLREEFYRHNAEEFGF